MRKTKKELECEKHCAELAALGKHYAERDLQGVAYRQKVAKAIAHARMIQKTTEELIDEYDQLGNDLDLVSQRLYQCGFAIIIRDLNDCDPEKEFEP